MWAKVVIFYRACWDQVMGPAPVAAATDQVQAKDPAFEEHYELDAQCRKQRLDALEKARGYPTEQGRLPSKRMWGRMERQRRASSEYEVVAFSKIQSEQQALAGRTHSLPTPAVDDALAWRLPAIAEAKPTTYDGFETACYTWRTACT